MSDIDRDALVAALARKLHRGWCHDANVGQHSYGTRDWEKAAPLVDAILPTVTQAIRAAEQRCIHGERCITCRAIVKRRNSPDYPDPDPLARGGSTEERT